jgi:hypothetical protein
MRKIKYFNLFLDQYRVFEDNGTNFSQAFAAARRSGKKTFTWNNKLYTTDLKGVNVVNKNSNEPKMGPASDRESSSPTNNSSGNRTVYISQEPEKISEVDIRRGTQLYLSFIREKKIISRKSDDGVVLLVINKTISQSDQDTLIDFLQHVGYEVSLSPDDYKPDDGVVFRKREKDDKDTKSEEIMMPEAQTETDQKKLENSGKKLWNDFSKNKSLVTREMPFGKILVFKGEINELEKLELESYAKTYGWVVTTVQSDYKPGDKLIFRKIENLEKQEDLEKPSSEKETDNRDSIENGKNLYKKLVQQKKLVSRNFSFGDVWVYLGQFGTLDNISEENLIKFLETQGWVRSQKEADKKDQKEIVFRKKEDLEKNEGDKPTEEKTKPTDQNTENSDDNVIPPPSENRVEKIKELPKNLINNNQEIPREERCKRLFIDLDDRDRRRGEKTASSEEIEECKYCLQQYNWISRSKERIKLRYGLKGSGGSKSL